MHRTMTSMNFVFRSSTRKGRHPGSLSLRLIHNRQVKSVTLSGCSVYREEWDREFQSICYPAAASFRTAALQEIECVMSREREVMGELIRTLERRGRYTLEELLDLYRLKACEDRLLGYAESLARSMENRGQYRTARAYLTVTRGLIAFTGGSDIPLRQINACLVKDFEAHLKALGRLPNTISYYMRNLRAIYNKAAVDGLIVPSRNGNPFEGVYVGVTRTMKRALSVTEIQQMRDVPLPRMLQEGKPGTRRHSCLAGLNTAKRYFGFCFYSRGMSFIDMAFLRKSNVSGGFIRYIRRKTGQQIEVRITPELQFLMDLFAEETAGSEYVFPIIRDNGKPARVQYENALRTQNNRLKKLAPLAGITGRISTHWARHSWATAGKSVNLPVGVISECLGHTSENTTQIYLAQLNNSVLDEANERIALAIYHTNPGAYPTIRM